ncbi:MAG TPA: BPSS1780 family membrane protein [Rhodocyclaceae bacterium]|nr:BPSS1780 family membrane protein [Rhodocyclaceae bacterium]
MRAQALPARAGWRWLADGYAIYRRNPAMMMVLTASYCLSLLVLQIIPVAGVIAVYFAMPFLGVGLMNACRDLDWGRPVTPGAVFSGTKQNPRGLLILGAAYLVCALAVLGLMLVIDGGEFMRMLATKPEERTALEGGLFVPLLLIAIMTLISMAWWYAPVLAAWHGLTAPKALFFSFVACWLNWRPFLVYVLSIFLFGALLPAIFLFLIAATAPGAMRLGTTLVSMPVLMVLLPVIFVSFYVSYRDVFGVDERV